MKKMVARARVHAARIRMSTRKSHFVAAMITGNSSAATVVCYVAVKTALVSGLL